MTLSRTLARTAAILLAALAAPSLAQDYPSQPIRFIVPSGAGGGADVFARMFAAKMPELIGQNAFIENVPGAGGVVGAERVVNARRDGHTVLYGISPLATIIPALQKMPYGPNDLQPVTVLTNAPYVLLANNDLPVRTMAELIAYAKANPGKLAYASTGMGSGAHLGGELLAMQAGISMLHVPFKNTGIAELIGGQVHFKLEPPASAVPHAKGGRLRALAVTSPARVAALPDVPAIAETLPGYELMGWQGVWLPAGTPMTVVEKLRGAFVKALQYPDIREKIIAVGAEPIGNSPAEMQRMIDRELAQFSKLIRERGIKAE
jgi:tripartite-type tricarboxylate transporter receptor subunit TctC